MIRLFAAVSAEAAAPELAPAQCGLDGARWRPAVSLHVTLAFYGGVKEDLAGDLAEALDAVGRAGFDIRIRGVGAFDVGGEPHAVWAAVEADAALEALAARCAAAGRRLGLRPETRRYRPHVTLAYLRGTSAAAVGRWLSANAELAAAPIRTRAFSLYSSWSGTGGSAYRVEQTYPLAD